jgi:uncharacterized protein (DUF1501 family)
MNAQAILSTERDDPRTLVVIFLRGAADGLSLLAPVSDDFYHRARPNLGVKPGQGVRLDDRFALHPLLAPLRPAWESGELLGIPAAGLETDTRSHFEAQDLMEHGGVVAGGWLGRFLRNRDRPATSALSAIAFAKSLPDCLFGAPNAVAMQSLADFTLGSKTGALREELAHLYAAESGEIGLAAAHTLQALARIESLHAAKDYTPGGGAVYGRDDFNQGLMQIARLIKADVGLEAASVDLEGWDTHFVQQTAIEGKLKSLGEGLAAFRADLGPRLATTSVVVMTEFGRRVAENSTYGTDHGRGGAMFVLGGGVRGRRIAGEWRGLSAEILDGPGDVPVWNNYRNVLAPILARHGARDFARIFPEFSLQPLDV